MAKMKKYDKITDSLVGFSASKQFKEMESRNKEVSQRLYSLEEQMQHLFSLTEQFQEYVMVQSLDAMRTCQEQTIKYLKSKIKKAYSSPYSSSPNFSVKALGETISNLRKYYKHMNNVYAKIAAIKLSNEHMKGKLSDRQLNYLARSEL